MPAVQESYRRSLQESQSLRQEGMVLADQAVAWDMPNGMLALSIYIGGLYGAKWNVGVANYVGGSGSGLA